MLMYTADRYQHNYFFSEIGHFSRHAQAITLTLLLKKPSLPKKDIQNVRPVLN